MDICIMDLIVSHYIAHDTACADYTCGKSHRASEENDLVSSVKVARKARANAKACSFVTVIDAGGKNIGSRSIELSGGSV